RRVVACRDGGAGRVGGEHVAVAREGAGGDLDGGVGELLVVRIEHRGGPGEREGLAFGERDAGRDVGQRRGVVDRRYAHRGGDGAGRARGGAVVERPGDGAGRGRAEVVRVVACGDERDGVEHLGVVREGVGAGQREGLAGRIVARRDHGAGGREAEHVA